LFKKVSKLTDWDADQAGAGLRGGMRCGWRPAMIRDGGDRY